MSRAVPLSAVLLAALVIAHPVAASPAPVPAPVPAPAEAPMAAEAEAPALFGAIDLGAGPIVEAVEFANRTYFKDETLRSFMLHPIPGDLNEGLLKGDTERVTARFLERGFLRARVTLRLEPTASPRGVKAIFDIDAGERAELKRVKVVGNVLVPEAALKEGFFSRPPEPLGALTRAGFFHKPYLDQDAQRLVANYYKRGHLEARVLDTRVDADPALDGLSVTLRVSEGPVYELGTLTFSGELPPMSPAEMRAHITVQDGDIADLVTIQTQADVLLEPLRLAGHPFARFEQSVTVVPPPSGMTGHRAVALTLKFVRGAKPTVREVRIAGNRGTAERVIRRDIAVDAGRPYDHLAMKKTERAVMSTGFFSAVQARAVPVSDEPPVIDVEVAVTEQQTWLASVAPAFDTSTGGEGLIGVGILADRNFLGTGLFVSAFLRLSEIKQNFDLTVSEPRFLDSRVSLTGEAHRREISFFDFRVRSEVGAGLRTNVPIGMGLFFGAGVGVEYGGVIPYAHNEKNAAAPGDPFDSPPVLLNGAGDYGLLPTGVFRNPISLSLSWDQRDSLLLPRNGAFASVSTSYAGPFTLSGLAFLDTDASLKLFWTPVWGITLKSNTAAAGVFNPHGGEVPITDRYFLGGLGSVRGFPALSIGPTVEVPTTEVDANGDPVRDPLVPIRAGGVARFVQNLEIEFPLWPQTPFRGFVFLDAGNTWSAGELAIGRMNALRDIPNNGVMPLGLFYSTGFGVLLETPVLPFRFEWSLPLTARENLDRPISFFLGIGSAF